jgi:hypothetical protein
MMSDHEITRTYYKDGKLISEFIPPKDFYLDPTVELRAAIATLTQRIAKLEAALRDYGSHDNGCTFYDSMQDHCSCGYSKALVRARHPIT